MSNGDRSDGDVQIVEETELNKKEPKWESYDLYRGSPTSQHKTRSLFLINRFRYEIRRRRS